ncbi:hemicentin-2-like [Stylophora pistillata]|uniref:hemicentin-2-like n=1 Tax=Stylophora pistillata TaxID=50429 RepID=UPI000C055730|nr:hemicentin-2-like [Stylophora pistillata]
MCKVQLILEYFLAAVVVIPTAVCQVSFTSTGGDKVTGVIGGSVNFTWAFTGNVRRAQLERKEVPKISLSSAQKNYTEGSYALIGCTASGKPQPDVTWIRKGIEISSGKGAAFLVINLRRTDEGLYTCRANNSVEIASKDTTLLVHYPPTIQEVTQSTKKSWIGQIVTLNCLSDGVPTPILTWHRPDGSEVKRVRARENRIKVRLRGDGDFGDYKCNATNGLSPSDNRMIKMRQIKTPGIPSITVETQASLVTVRWTAPTNDGGSPITAYRAIILKSDIEIKSINITDPGTKNYTFVGLERDTAYIVKVFARNRVFEGYAGANKILAKFAGKQFQFLPIVGFIKVQKEAVGNTEFRLTATVNESCSRRLQVAARFPNVACDLVVNHGCLAALTVESVAVFSSIS